MKKVRPGEERHFAVRGKCVGASNGDLPFEEIMSWLAQNFCLLLIFRSADKFGL
ncbi:MAG: hypothetical protein K2J14_08125 [Treponemataceae bacterium]|nr:hypothetical protein [Treponemataceae bacterium]